MRCFVIVIRKQNFLFTLSSTFSAVASYQYWYIFPLKIQIDNDLMFLELQNLYFTNERMRRSKSQNWKHFLQITPFSFYKYEEKDCSVLSDLFLPKDLVMLKTKNLNICQVVERTELKFWDERLLRPPNMIWNFWKIKIIVLVFSVLYVFLKHENRFCCSFLLVYFCNLWELSCLEADTEEQYFAYSRW